MENRVLTPFEYDVPSPNMEPSLPTPPLYPSELALSMREFRHRRAKRQRSLAAKGNLHPSVFKIFEDKTATPLPPPPPFVFHRFRKFPPSVREQIWMEAFPQNRIVHLKIQPGYPRWPNATKLCSSSSPPPAVMHVCKESRAIALRYYKPNFSIDIPELDYHTRLYPIYFNPTHDIVFPTGLLNLETRKMYTENVMGFRELKRILCDDYLGRSWYKLWGSGDEFLKKVGCQLCAVYGAGWCERSSKKGNEKKKKRARVDFEHHGGEG